MPFTISGVGYRRDGLASVYPAATEQSYLFSLAPSTSQALWHGPSWPGRPSCTLELVLCTEELRGGEMEMLIKCYSPIMNGVTNMAGSYPH